MRLLRRLPAAVVCALAAHALVYRTVTPGDGSHGYFGWYEPVVAVASAACLCGLLVLVAVAAAARRLGRPVRLGVAEPAPLAASARSLGAASLAVYVVQETVERSVASGHPSVSVLAPSQSLTLLAGIAAASCLLSLALRLGHAVVRRVMGGPVEPARVGLLFGWSVRTARALRPRPLAGRFALRAPPLLPS
jgi:uncharacterized membrane protein YeiB